MRVLNKILPALYILLVSTGTCNAAGSAMGYIQQIGYWKEGSNQFYYISIDLTKSWTYQSTTNDPYNGLNDDNQCDWGDFAAIDATASNKKDLLTILTLAKTLNKPVYMDVLGCVDSGWGGTYPKLRGIDYQPVD